MENPPTEPAATTEAPPPAPAATSPPLEAPSAAAATPSKADGAWSRPPPDRARSNLKVAGVVMVVIGAMVAWQAYVAQGQVTYLFSDDEVKVFADNAGGNITVEVPGSSPMNPAHVAVNDFNGTELAIASTGEGGKANLEPTNVGVRVVVTWNNSTWIRKAIAPPNYDTVVRIESATAPATLESWQQPDASGYLPWIWTGFAVGIVLVVTGVFAFRLRGPKIAMAGAVIFLLGALTLTAYAARAGGFSFGSLLQPLLFAAMGGFCIWSVRTAWSRFEPLRLGGLEL